MITSNAEFTPANGVTGGSGTASSPYIISNLDLVDNGGTSISLVGADAYVQIEDVNICMVVLPQNTTETQTGIYLQSASHVNVENVAIYSPSPEPVVFSATGEPEPIPVGLGVSVLSSGAVSFSEVKIVNITSGFSINSSDNARVENSTMSYLPNRDIFAELTNDNIFEDNTMGGGNAAFQGGQNGYNFQI